MPGVLSAGGLDGTGCETGLDTGYTQALRSPLARAA
jgi:hypothetical protein